MLIILMVAGAMSAEAQKVVRKRLVDRQAMLDSAERVIVGGDTVSTIIPERNFGRYDRGLYNHLFIPKGKWGFGLTASYGELSTEDSGILNLLNDVDFKGKMYSIKPDICYFP